MKKFACRVFSLLGRTCFGIADKIYHAPETLRVIPWEAANGDKTLRLDYDLGGNSVVFDCGGYEGQWSSDIFARYCCRIQVFEPIASFADAIAERFACNPLIHVHNFGLGSSTLKTEIAVCRDGSSLYRNNGDLVEADIIRAADFIIENGFDRIDLMKINIEGAEYDLLEHLLDSHLTTRIRDIQVQFHDFVPDAEARMRSIQGRLENTHCLTYQYPYVWENWRLKLDCSNSGE